MLSLADPSKDFRIQFKKSGRINGQKQKLKVAMMIQEPVRNEYQKIDLKKRSTYQRIDHKSTKRTKQKLSSFPHSNSHQQTDNWQNTLSCYMQAKERYLHKNIENNDSFSFLKLSKINTIRKRLLIKSNSISPQKVSNFQEVQSQQIENYDSKKALKNSCSMKMKSNPRKQLKMHSRFKSLRQKTQISDESDQISKLNCINVNLRQRLPREQRILNSFISKYFKSKLKYTHGSYRRNYGTYRTATDLSLNISIKGNTKTLQHGYPK